MLLILNNYMSDLVDQKITKANAGISLGTLVLIFVLFFAIFFSVTPNNLGSSQRSNPKIRDDDD